MRAAVVMWVLTLSGVGCDTSVTLPPGTPSAAEVAVTPRGDRLAERLAVRCATTLIADQAVYDTLNADLDAIGDARGERPTDFGAAYPDDAGTTLGLSLPHDRDLALLDGDEPAFDALNRRLGAEVRYLEGWTQGDGLLLLDFPGIYQDDLLAALYEAAVGAEPGAGWHSVPTGDGDRITYDLASSPRRYVLSHGEGDCPAGCIDRTYTYWTVDDAGAVEVDAFESAAGLCGPDAGRLP